MLLTQWKELLDLRCSEKWPLSVFPVMLNFCPEEWTIRLELVNNMTNELGMALLGIDFSSDEINTTEFDLKYQINSAQICNIIEQNTVFISKAGLFQFPSNPLREMVSEKLSWKYPVYIPIDSGYTKEEFVISDRITQNLTFISGKDRDSYLDKIGAIRRYESYDKPASEGIKSLVEKGELTKSIEAHFGDIDGFLKSAREKKDVTIRNAANPNSFFLIKYNRTPTSIQDKKETYCGFEPGFLIGKRF